jgi:uncharacterized cupin superfamily protein
MKGGFILEPHTRNQLSRIKAASVVIAVGCAIAIAGSSAAVAAPQMIVYRAGERVPESQLIDLGPPEVLGGIVLEGDPKISARIDYAEGNRLAGVFQATRGTVLIYFPLSEHATILNGEVELTDEWGNTTHLGAGDSYFITQGTIVLWEVHGERVQKTFFNRTMEDDTPAPMVIYKRRDEVGQSELIDLGPPEGLGGTVVSGDPKISARIDHHDGSATGGVFQATRGEVQIRFPFTEHATVIEGAVTLTDDTGQTARLLPGDSYLILQDSAIFGQVARGFVQKSFFNFVDD